MASQRGALSIADLIFHVPALAGSFYVGWRHGFHFTEGWIWLVILSLSRIVFAILILVDDSSTSDATRTGLYVLASVGLGPLLLAIIAFLKRIQENMEKRSASPTLFNLLGIVPIVGFIVSTIGAVNIGSDNQDTVREGYTLNEVGNVLSAVTFGLCCVVVFWTLVRCKDVQRGDRELFWATTLSMPFVLVRVVAALLVAYSLQNPGTPYHYTRGNIYFLAFMIRFEEYVAMVLLLAAGFRIQKLDKIPIKTGRWEEVNDEENTIRNRVAEGYELSMRSAGRTSLEGENEHRLREGLHESHSPRDNRLEAGVIEN